MKKEKKNGRVFSLFTKQEIPQEAIPETSQLELENQRTDYMADVEYLLFKVKSILERNCKDIAEYVNPEITELVSELHKIENVHASNSAKASTLNC